MNFTTLIIIAIQIISAIACVILVKFMIKPYVVTREGRYIGLPLGFGILGISYILSAIYWAQPEFFEIKWFPVLFRAFSFAFIAASYYFSKKPLKNTKVYANITLSALIAGLTILALTAIIFVQFTDLFFERFNPLLGIFIIICITYICIHCFREYTEDPDPATPKTLVGYGMLGASYATFLIGNLINYEPSRWPGLILRLIGLFILVFIAYQSFHKKKGTKK